MGELLGTPHSARGILIVFEDATVAAVLRRWRHWLRVSPPGRCWVLATERFIAAALEAAGGEAPLAAVAGLVLVLFALFAVEVLQTAVRGLTDARIEKGLRNGFRADLTAKQARLEYGCIESPSSFSPVAACTIACSPPKPAGTGGIEAHAE